LEPQRIKLDTQFGTVYLKGKLDRVDERILDGRRYIVVLDYKTGDYRLPRKDISKVCSMSNRRDIKKAIGSFQLPLYIYLFCESKKISPSIVQASFYSLREIKEEFLFGQGDSQKLLEIYLTAARKIVSEIMCPDSDFVRDDSDEYYCRFCPFFGLCKR